VNLQSALQVLYGEWGVVYLADISLEFVKCRPCRQIKFESLSMYMLVESCM